MNKFIIIIISALSIGLVLSANARQKLPNRDVLIDTNVTYKILTTEKNVQETTVTFDDMIYVNKTNSIATFTIANNNAINLAALSNNVDSISNDLNQIDTNTYEISNISNIIDNIETNITSLQGQSETNTALFYGMYQGVDIISGAAGIWHKVTYNSYLTNSIESACNLSAGTITISKSGFYLITESFVLYDSSSPEDWEIRLGVNGDPTDFSTYIILYGSTEEGKSSESTAQIIYLTSGDVAAIYINHQVNALSASIRLEKSKFNITYIGDKKL